MSDDDTKNLPDAVTPADLRHLLIGPPFAIAGEAEFLPHDAEKGVVGSVSSIQCDCGQAFKINLLDNRAVACPKCKRAYTHVLLVCRTDDADMFDDLVFQVLEANGIAPPDDEDAEDDDDNEDDADDDDEEDDDEGDTSQ